MAAGSGYLVIWLSDFRIADFASAIFRFIWAINPWPYSGKVVEWFMSSVIIFMTNIMWCCYFWSRNKAQYLFLNDLYKQGGERPKLTDEMDSLASLNDHTSMGSGSKSEGPEVEHEALRFLVNLFRRCTTKNPADRPSARDIYDSILLHVRDFISIHSWEPERLVIKLP